MAGEGPKAEAAAAVATMPAFIFHPGYRPSGDVIHTQGGTPSILAVPNPTITLYPAISKKPHL